MMEMGGSEAQKLVWGGAIPLQIHLHDSEITALTPPPPLLVLGPRLGYLPLLAPLVKPHFSGSLPPVVDTMWFEYKGLPLKWYIPTGVLFDLLCAEPERPWNLTVHFRGYPSELLSPCDGEDSVKWNFINSLKEAAYIINGNCKNVMNMSQSDQLELWKCVEKGNLEGYLRIASKLKLGGVVEEAKAKASSQPSTTEADHRGPGRTGRFPVRMYVRNIDEDLEELADATSVDSWDDISYLNQPVDTRKKEGMCVTLLDAVKALLPEVFTDESSINEGITQIQSEDVPTSTELDEEIVDVKNIVSMKDGAKEGPSDKPLLANQSTKSRIKRICIQGIEPDMDLPFSWVIYNLINPEFYLHVCVYVGVSTDENGT